MGAAEIISLSDVRASRHWELLREQLHTRFADWLDELQKRLPEPAAPLAEVTEAIWQLRQDLTGGIAATILTQAHRGEQSRAHAPCAQCERPLSARPPVARTVETMVGAVHLERPYFYCPRCRCGRYPFDERVDLTPGRHQLDVQQAAAQLVIELPYDTAQTVFRDLTGVSMGSERMHTRTNEVAAGLTVLDVAPSREEMARRIAEVATGTGRRPVVVLGIDGAYVPTRPESARGRRPGRGRHRAKRARWQGQWREAKGFRFYLMAGERIIHLLSWHQVQTEADLGTALQQVKDAGLIPEAQVRLCVVCDGAAWIWKQVQTLFPHAQQVLDYYHCAEYLHKVAQAQYGATSQAHEGVEATLTRLYLGKVTAVLGGLRRMPPTSTAAADALAKCWDYLEAHRGRTHYRKLRHGGYPLGSGGIEAANKFICHVRLKRSGAWWYELSSNQMLALRCAKYNGTFTQVFARHLQRLRST